MEGYLQNLHTHTCYCDGLNTPEEVVLIALEKGFSSVGFSEHSYMKYSPTFLKIGDNTEKYKKEIHRLKDKYRHRIHIYCGLEADIYSETDLTGYDYLIGSVHYLRCGEEYVGFDVSADIVERIINQYFGGKSINYAKAYYRTLSELPNYGNYDIIGHFDLITKHEDTRQFFNVSSKEYLYAAIEAAQSLAGKVPFFEINTGAMARGYRRDPYPSMTLIKELKRLGFGVVITSDCHDGKKLDYKFDEMAELLKTCGYREKYCLCEQGFVAMPL